MRVLLITGSFPPMRCGVGDYTHHLGKALAAIPEISVGVLTNTCCGKIGKVDNIECFPVIKAWNISESLKIIKIIRQWSPDVVHIQYPTQGYGSGFLPWLLPLISYALGKKVVQTWHEVYGRRSAWKLFLKAIIPGGLVVVRPEFKDILPSSLHWSLWNKQYAFIRNASPIPKADHDETAKADLRRHYLKGQKQLLVFFGFVYPNKGVELLFEMADPALSQIVIAGAIVEDSDYHNKIISLASSAEWSGKVSVTGFLPSSDIAALLAIADAVILPYRTGGGEWNTSIHAAVLQGTFVITTASTAKGYDEKNNVFYAKVDDVQEMKTALQLYAGKRRQYDDDIDRDEWQQIANKHRLLYDRIVSE